MKQSQSKHQYNLFIPSVWTKAMFLLFCVACIHSTQAQTLSNIRSVTIESSSDTLQIDTLSIIPNTLSITTASGNIVPAADYDFYPFSAKLIWKQKPSEPIRISYRAYPVMYANRYFHKDYRSIAAQTKQFTLSPFVYNPTLTSPNDFMDFGTLDYSGNFSRGISFGSNQDVILNSVLNLQLQGKLAEDLEVVANITDNNIPIQPDGNTQNLQEFDKIFIQLRKGKQAVTVGDFDMIEGRNYFMRYSKKAQGASVDLNLGLKKYGQLKVRAGGGISRGKFARNTLLISEGTQGPYKLVGANNEAFITILANTEEVFINGVKQKRGFDQDYVIDYNLGQITFTPKRIITRDLRITVEFEYSERSYQRTLFDAALQWDYKKTRIGFNLYTEQDSKNQNFQQNLDANKKTFLAGLGDSIDNAFYNGVDSVAYDANRILYERVDTAFIYGTDTVPISFYRNSSNPATAKYALTFILVGDGKGHYKAAQTTANGRVYEYTAPTLNASNQLIPSGNYEPKIKLITPVLNQLYTLNIQQDIGKNVKVNVEGALSNKDVNLFSKLNDNNNLGAGAHGNVTFNKTLNATKNPATITAVADYEFANKTFNFIERYRTIEFSRDFNLASTLPRKNEHLGRAGLQYTIQNLLSTEYRFRTFIQDSIYKGFEHYVNLQTTIKGFYMRINTSALHSTSIVSSTQFFRPQGEISYTFKKLNGWKTGIIFNHEINKTKQNTSDTLDPIQSRLWQEYRYYIVSADTLQNNFKVEYFARTEQAAKGKGFASPGRISHNVSFSGNVTSLRNQGLAWTLTYRRVDEKDPVKAQQELQNYYLGRIDYNFTALKGLIKSTTFYELGTGREQKLQLVYIYSPTGTGDYVLQKGQDRNNITSYIAKQGVLNAGDSTYIRTFQTTPEYLPVNSTQFNQALTLNPSALLKNPKNGGQKFINLFSTFSNLQLSKKIYSLRSNKAYEYFLPFSSKTLDTNLVQLTINSRNSLFINRFSSKINAQIDVNYLKSKTLLTSGNEIRISQNQSLTIRWNIYKELLLQSSYNHGTKANLSDFYLTQQYNINLHETSNELSYLYRNMIRLAFTYGFNYRKNTISVYGGQLTTQHNASVDFRFSKSGKTTVNSKFTVAAVKYNNNGVANLQAEYTLLEGLKNGINYIWNVGIEQKISSALQLIIGYDGRKTGTDKVINTARAEIRALF